MKKNGLALLILSFFLGMIIMVQFKTVDKTTGGIASSQKAKQLGIELKNLNEKKSILTKEIKELDSRIDGYKNAESGKSEVVKNLKDDIKKYEILAGYTDVHGPGVIVTIKEPSDDGNSNIILYNSELILAIINKLNAAGAEAISINGERVVSQTDIYLSGDKLLVNGNPIMPPIEIKGIGNAETLEAALNLRYGIIWEIRKYYGLEVSVEKQTDLKIPRYTQKLEFKYSKPVME